MNGESSNWREYAPIIEKHIRHRAEGPTLEKKREHYYLDEGMSDAEGRPVDHRKKRADFLKDLIALANAARRRNQTAYLCLGIAEDEDWSIFGVEGRHPRRNPRPSWAEVEEHPYLMNKWVESIQGAYVGFAKQYVVPELPHIDYETGWIEGHLIGLLVISPSCHPNEGFHLTEAQDKRKDLEELGLKPGYAWRRLGALNDEVRPEDRWVLKSSEDLPYIPKEGWETYLGNLTNHCEYQPQNPNQPDFYQPLQAQLEKGRSQSALVENASEFLDQWARADQEPRVLLITGPAGCGKTTLLHRLTRDLADSALQSIRSTHEGRPFIPGQLRALDYPKDVPIPVLIGLWGFDALRETPEERFRRSMTKYGGQHLKLDQHSSPAAILKDRDLKFLVILDGLDEMARHSAEQWETALIMWARFVQDYPNARFLIACRDDQLANMGPEWNSYPRIRLEPLLPTQVHQYLGATDWKALLDREDILSSVAHLLSNPRRLNALRETSAAVQSLGVVLESIMEGFLEEELNKYTHINQSERGRFRQGVSQLAFEMLVQGRLKVSEGKAREILGDENFDRLSRSGLLISDRSQWKFVDPLIHDYFAAQHISAICQDGEPEQINAIPDDRLWHRAIQIAVNIWPEDLSDGPVQSLLAKLEVKDQVQAISQRRFRFIRPEVVYRVLYGYLQRSDADLNLTETLLRDAVTQYAAILAVRAARYKPAADILYDIGSHSSGEVRSLIASILSEWGDPRGNQLQPEEEPEELAEAEEGVAEALLDNVVPSEPLISNILMQIGG